MKSYSLEQTAQIAREARQTLGLSQEAFAAAIGSAKKSVANWEGATKPPLGPALILLLLIRDGVLDQRHLRRIAEADA